MYERDLFNHKALALQIQRQKKYAWDLDKGIRWDLGVDPKKFLLPLDKDCIAFPGANAKQQLALSQLLGLVINSTISESEDVITRLKSVAWMEILRSYPVSPEMVELGELFFEEEKKHSIAFARYNSVFCEKMGIRKETLDKLIPKAYGSLFLKAMLSNAKWGGHSFWWVVGAVEEVSIELYKEIHKHKAMIDPLYFEVHFKHMEEESRHHNYAFLMLDIIAKRQSSLQRLFYKKTDLIFGQAFASAWIVSELGKIFEAKRFAHEHEFFSTIASCEPLLRELSWMDLAKRLFISAPYISLVLNTKNHKQTSWMAEKQKALNFPFPHPKNVETFAEPNNLRALSPYRKKKKNVGANSRKRAS